MRGICFARCLHSQPSTGITQRPWFHDDTEYVDRILFKDVNFGVTNPGGVYTGLFVNAAEPNVGQVRFMTTVGGTTRFDFQDVMWIKAKNSVYIDSELWIASPAYVVADSDCAADGSTSQDPGGIVVTANGELRSMTYDVANEAGPNFDLELTEIC